MCNEHFLSGCFWRKYYLYLIFLEVCHTSDWRRMKNLVKCLQGQISQDGICPKNSGVHVVPMRGGAYMQ